MPVSVKMYFWLLDIVFDFLAELADVNPQILRVGQRVPQFAHQELCG